MKEVGRLDNSKIKEIEAKGDDIFRSLDNDKIDLAQKKILKIVNTPNYFIREILGKKLASYKNHDVINPIILELLTHKIYGARATALFYYFQKYYDDPSKIVMFIDSTYDTTPWEVEVILVDLWRRYPQVMKLEMRRWLETGDEKKKALSFHGMENIAAEDPQYVLEFIGFAIDDPSMEVQKKITHLLTQVARIRPAESYPFIREWLINATEIRMRTIWVSMKKLANIIIQRSKKDKTEEFVILTTQTISDWRNDENEAISSFGTKLASIIYHGTIV